MIPWVALFIFPLHGIAHYWGQMFYPLGAFTGLVDLSSLPQIIQPYFFYDLFVYTMCISGISIIAVFVYCIRKHTLLDGDIDV